MCDDQWSDGERGGKNRQVKNNLRQKGTFFYHVQLGSRCRRAGRQLSHSVHAKMLLCGDSLHSESRLLLIVKKASRKERKRAQSSAGDTFRLFRELPRSR